MRHLTCLFASCAFLASCAHQSTGPVPVVSRTEVPVSLPPSPDTAPPAQAPAVPRPPQPARQLADGSQLPAVKGLVASADSALARGEVELASVSLERAQRLAPQSVVVYQKLARVRLKQSRPAEAEQMARKALAYAAGPAQQAELWRLIASARRQRGQQASAQEAEAKAAALEEVSTADAAP